jgi:hypothetical protein
MYLIGSSKRSSSRPYSDEGMASIDRCKEPTIVEVLVTPALADGSAADPSDPYRYGWHYVRCDLDDGTYVMDQIPLTLVGWSHWATHLHRTPPVRQQHLPRRSWRWRRIAELSSWFEPYLSPKHHAVIQEYCQDRT